MRSSQVLVHWGQTTGLFFDFDSNDQVSVLCNQIQSRIGLPAHVQRLVCEGRVLNPSHTFAGYGIQHAANISIALDLKGGMPWNKDNTRFFCDNWCVSTMILIFIERCQLNWNYDWNVKKILNLLNLNSFFWGPYHSMLKTFVIVLVEWFR